MSEIKKVKKTIDVYEVYGKIFVSQEDAKAYASKIKTLLDYTFFDVQCYPDLTEGRGWQDTIWFAVDGNRYTLLEYLVNTFGNPLSHVKGVGFDPEGKTFDDPESLIQFLKSKVYKGIGDYRKGVMPELRVIDRRGRLDEEKTTVFKELMGLSISGGRQR